MVAPLVRKVGVVVKLGSDSCFFTSKELVVVAVGALKLLSPEYVNLILLFVPTNAEPKVNVNVGVVEVEEFRSRVYEPLLQVAPESFNV